MTVFLNEKRTEFDLYMVLDSQIFDWVNRQVRIATILPTPTPDTTGQFGGLLQFGQ